MLNTPQFLTIKITKSSLLMFKSRSIISLRVGILLGVMALGLAGCGQKGALSLVDKRDNAITTPAAEPQERPFITVNDEAN